MSRIKILLGTLVVVLTTVFVFSCAKDNPVSTKEEISLSNERIEQLYSILGIDKNVELRSVTMLDCGNTTAGCSLIEAGKKDTILMPGTSCYAEVTYDLYVCPIPGSSFIINYVFNNFSAYPIAGMGCDSILNSWIDLFTLGDFNELNNQLDLFNSIALKIVEKNYINYLFSDPFIQSIFNCNNLNSFLYTEFNVSNCFQHCIYYAIINGQPVFDHQTSTCGESCCKRTTLYCWNTALNQLDQSLPNIQVLGNCISSTPGEGCSIGYRPLGICQHQCFLDEM
ncbi:MAG: hypothetical protein LC107_07245 [Chitinophagales bacterium]|nr:hypothetical protein [Chitinophagales bacterium]